MFKYVVFFTFVIMSMVLLPKNFSFVNAISPVSQSEKIDTSQAPEQPKKDYSVYVESEFAPLKRAVVSQSEIELGGKLKDLKIGKHQQNLWNMERQNLEIILKKYNVEILRPRKLTNYEKQIGFAPDGITDGTGFTNFFARDPFFTIGENLIEGSFRSVYRRLEILPIRSILEKEAASSGCMYVSVPVPDVSEGIDSDTGPFLEGGDILVYGKKIFVGNSGMASNKKGIDWLGNYLKKFDYEVYEVALAPDVLHLDCVVSLVREGLLIYCPETLPEGLPETFKDWDKISVNYDAMRKLAVNGLPINEEVYLTDTEFKNTIGAELEKRGIKVEYISFSTTRTFGGAFRCSVQPLLRISD